MRMNDDDLECFLAKDLGTHSVPRESGITTEQQDSFSDADSFVAFGPEPLTMAKEGNHMDTDHIAAGAIKSIIRYWPC